MKIARMILVFLVLSIPAVSAQMPPVKDSAATDAASLRLLLNSFAALGEDHIEHVLSSLRVISVTEEARSGEWEKMKRTLAELETSGIKASAVWFMRTDGSYYVGGRDLTDQNLSDRRYFQRLMAGEEISGDLVIDKVTGERNAVVAVPIIKNGKIIGALGASLNLEAISRMLDEKSGLPQNMFFYALDQKGQTSLHRISSLLLASPSDMGSKSLSKTVGEMLEKNEGAVTYDFYGERSVVYKKFPLTGWVYAIGVITGRSGEPSSAAPPVLSELQKAVTAELDKVDQRLAKLARRLSEKDLNTSEKRIMLDDLCRTYPYAVDCAVVDRNGKMVIIEPRKYEEFEGTDISAQEQVIRLRQSGKPVLSNVIRTAEGPDAVDLEHPVFSLKGDFEGSVSLLLSPESFFSYVLAPVLKGMPVAALVMQTDGRIIYDQDKKEIGRMLFEDPIYKPFPQLIAIGTMACREKSGSGSYDFMQGGSEKPVKKDAHWSTVGLHGTEWRIVVMHTRPDQANSSGVEITKPGAGSYAAALRTLAADAGLKKSCARNDIEMIREIFRKFYSDFPGLYSVQWLDASGMNRYGYPEENSLTNFDIRTSKTPSSKPMLQALSDKKESVFDRPLVEGKTGTFFMVPVHEGGEYLGMLYTIRIKE